MSVERGFRCKDFEGCGVEVEGGGCRVYGFGVVVEFTVSKLL